MAIVRKFMAIFAILTMLLMGMAVHPTTTKAAAPEPSAASQELFRLYLCRPAKTQGNGTGVTWNEDTGKSKMLPEMEALIAKEGGFCRYAAGSVMTIHMSSPTPVVVKTDNVTYAETKFLIATGLSFEFQFKPGDLVAGWEIQVWYGFPQVDPFARVDYQFGTPPNYFKETGHAIDSLFINYWQSHGGVGPFGLPLTERGYHWLSGKLYQVQYFERARFEYHPENANPYTIELGQFGRQVMEARVIHSNPEKPGTKKDDTCTYDPNTSHYQCGLFGEYWTANGGLAQFGRPLTEEFTEKLENGQTYKVQYFERARLEYHPENPAPYIVQLGQFGRYVLGGIQAIRLESAGMQKP